VSGIAHGTTIAPANGLELSCPAEAGRLSLLYGTPAGRTSRYQGPARRVSFSELLGAAASTWIAHSPGLATSHQLLNYLSTWNTWSHTSSPSMRVFVLWKPKPELKDLTHGPSRAHITKPSSGSSSSRRISAYMHLVKQ